MQTYTPWFPNPGAYIRYFDFAARQYRYRKLLWRRDPLKYPKRLPSLAAGAKGDTVTFDEIEPSKDKKHIYLAYLGVSPGFMFYLWHPYDIKTLKWDEEINNINEDLCANIQYEQSPIEFPTKAIGIETARYPAVSAYNVSGETKTPEIIWIASLYIVKEHTDLTQEEISKLESGVIPSFPWDFGGEI